MPECFSRPICRLAMQLNDTATDAQRQRLLPFATRLACADTLFTAMKFWFVKKHTAPVDE
jgi:hypothetical protein